MMLNKKFSKVLCAVLAFAMIVTMLPAMALVASADEATEAAGVNKLAFSDIANSPYQREIGVLNAISVLAGDPAGTFRPGDSISRAEMAAIIVRIYGMESNVVSGATKFDDVPADHWSSGYVNIASGLGVINGDGDGKFRPDDKVKYNEAVKMLVCVLGYGMHAQEQGGWPAGYLVQATMLGIDEDVINQAGEASRETVAKLVYNTIDLEYLEKVGYGTDEQWVAVAGRTLLSEKMKVTKIEDIVSETFTTSLFGEGSLKEGQVRIGNTRLLLGDSDIAQYVGYPVVAYAKYDSKVDKTLSTLAYYEIMEEDVAIFDIIPDDVAGATKNSITLFEDYENSSKTVKYVTDGETYIFENGVGNMEFDLSTLYANGKATFQGKLVLIDIDEDEIIDALFVENTETIVVASIAKSSTGFYIRGKHTNERFPAKGNIDLSNDEVKVSITKDGEAIDYKDLKDFDVLTYTKNGNIYNFTVCNETVKGVVEQITSEDEIVVGGNAYEKSAYYIGKVDKDLAEEPSIGDEVVMYLDIYGEVAYVEIIAATGADTYAYVLGMQKEKGFEGEEQYSLILYTTDNEKISLPVAEKVIFKKNVYAFDVDGSKIASTDLEVETIEEKVKDAKVADFKKFGIFDADGKPIKQMIKYAAANDEITEIETALNIVPFATKGTISIDTVKNGVHSVVEVDAEANEAAVKKINEAIHKKTPNKYDDELDVFTKTIAMYNGKLLESTCKKSDSGYFSGSGSPTAGDTAYKWKGSTMMFMPNEAGTVLSSDISFFSTDEFFGSYNDYFVFDAKEFEMYDCDKKGTAGMIVVNTDVTSSQIVGDRRGTYMLVTKVGVGIDADGESIYRINGHSNVYNTNSVSEITLDVPSDIATTSLNDSSCSKKGEDLSVKDLSVGDIICYRKLPNGKVYAVKVLFSLKYNKGSCFVDFSTNTEAKEKSASSLANGDTLYQGVFYGNIVYATNEDGEDKIKLTIAADGSSVELDGGSNVTGDFDPTGFKNYFVYDTTKKTLKSIEFADIPLPEELDEDTLDLEKLPANVFKVTDEEGNTYYAKCPKVYVQLHCGDSKYKKVNFIYVDDGSFN